VILGTFDGIYYIDTQLNFAGARNVIKSYKDRTYLGSYVY